MAQSKEYLDKVGKKFGQGLDPVAAGKKGGKAKSFEKYLKEQFQLELGEKFDATSIFNAIEKLLNKSVKELRDIEANDDLPSTLTTIASGILKDKKAGRISTIESLWDRLHGKSIERVEQKVEKTTDKEQVKREIKDLMGKLGYTNTTKG